MNEGVGAATVAGRLSAVQWLVNADDVDRRCIVVVASPVGDVVELASGLQCRPLEGQRPKPDEFQELEHPVLASEGDAALTGPVLASLESVPV